VQHIHGSSARRPQLQILEKEVRALLHHEVLKHPHNEPMSFSLPLVSVIMIIKYLRLFSASTLVIFNSVLFRLESASHLKESAF
jgi:hypothetical protein